MLALVLVMIIGLAGVAAPRPEFAVGQVWKYATRAGDEGSTLTILRIDHLPDQGIVVHVAVTGLSDDVGRGPAGGKISHVPMSLEALRGSVTELVAVVSELPPHEQGIAMWEKARAGWFTVPVSEVVELVRNAIRR